MLAGLEEPCLLVRQWPQTAMRRGPEAELGAPDERTRKVKQILELPAGMDEVRRAGRRRMEGHTRQGWRFRARGRTSQARCNGLREVHICFCLAP